MSAVDKSFLQLCLGEAATDRVADREEEQDVDADEEQEAGRKMIRYLLNADDSDDECENPELEGMYAFDASAGIGGGTCQSIQLDDGHDEDVAAIGSYEDAFDFDMRQVADAVKKGVPTKEVSALIQAEMFQSLQERLQRGTTTEQDTTARPGMTEDLSGMMTPPPAADAGASSVDSDKLKEKLGALEKQTPTRYRRSSIAQHPQLLEAVGAAASRHRQSLTHALQSELAGKSVSPALAGRVRQSLVGMQRQRRASLIKAAEVLEEAGVGTEGSNDSPEEVEAKLQQMQKAVEGAWKRHRASVATALEAASRSLGDGDLEVADPGKPMPSQALTQERVNQVVAAAYAKHRGKGKGPTHYRALMCTRLITTMPGKSAYTVHCGPAPPARRVGSKRC